MQPLDVMGPKASVMVADVQASVAVATPGAGTPEGLQPRSAPGGQKVNVGGAESDTQVNTCVHVLVFPQASVAVYVRICVLLQPTDEIDPSALVMVATLQPSVAVAAPGAGTPEGLKPKS
jgi:hypothetical protein